ncbi:MAG: discoidin domain-containing protein [Akkermansiaceae bacterium]|nr:discoidin domain-containing protein [Akkermansiaceae bacterium]
MRTEIRHANIERPLKYCAETDHWDDDSKFRFVIETSEPITSFLGTHGASDGDALARRIREGRIQVGGVLATVNTEQLGHEVMARLFYLSGRHVPDLLGVPRGRTALINDVIGLTSPFATFLKEARCDYLFHGHNGCGHCLKPAESEPVFHWQGPDRDPSRKVLVRSVTYGGYAGDSLGDASPARIETAIATLGRDWPYDALLLQDGTDFQLITRDNANKIREWNSRYEHPRLVCATMDMFFDAIAAQAKPSQVKTFAKDANNQWADQDANDAWLLGQARRLGSELPTAEKLATITTVLRGGAFPWTGIYQAYHRLLLYHEHTNAIDFIAPQIERMRQYETEQAEHREMVTEAQDFTREVTADAMESLAGQATTSADDNLLVFNPLPRQRTDVVRFLPDGDSTPVRIVDTSTGRDIPHQVLPDGSWVFLASDVPPTGYKTFALHPAGSATECRTVDSRLLENDFYRVKFDARTGGISSLFDREFDAELVDQGAPHHLGEYLYERIERLDSKATPAWYRAESPQVSAVSGPVADVVTVASTGRGVESIVQTVLLYRNLKRIDFTLDMIKAPSGRTSHSPATSLLNKESAYIALPFSVPDHRFRHELPGGVAEPIRDQFEGSCTAFYAVRHFSDVSNSRYGVTVSPVESALVEYGHPRSCPLLPLHEDDFEREMRYPDNSRMYLYLLNNMFSVNVRWDQSGPMRFSWALRSHAGDWRQGKAAEFGWDIHSPLVAHRIRGRRDGPLGPAAGFLKVEPANVVCTTIKPSEANGSGFVLRFHETSGLACDVKVNLPLLPDITNVTETDLIENDLPQKIQLGKGSSFGFAIPAFGIKTIRVSGSPGVLPQHVRSVAAEPVSDMQIRLRWPRVPDATSYRVYRGESAEFRPTLLNLVGRTAEPVFLDQPELNYGGWINNRLEPATTYHYRIAAVDRMNREGVPSEPVSVTTLDSSHSNMPPLKVEALRAVRVSPLAPFNSVNLLFRTSCEPDVLKYEVHRSTNPGFIPADESRIGWADADAIIKGSTAYGHVSVDYRAGQYDHMMYLDQNVLPETTYHYRVCAVDSQGQKGVFSDEAAVRTGPAVEKRALPVARASSSRNPKWYGPSSVVDGDPDTAWTSKPYGGGTRKRPADVWLEVDLPDPLEISGVVVVGDQRELIPLPPGLQIMRRSGPDWISTTALARSGGRSIVCSWDKPEKVRGIRLVVPAALLAGSEQPRVPDSAVRVAELLVCFPDGREQSLVESP